MKSAAGDWALGGFETLITGGEMYRSSSKIPFLEVWQWQNVKTGSEPVRDVTYKSMAQERHVVGDTPYDNSSAASEALQAHGIPGSWMQLEN